MSKKIKVPYIEGENIDKPAAEITLTENNWEKEFPYHPEVKAKLWHDGDNLYIRYDVKEKNIAALADKDNGEVWKDSCVEFFVSFDSEGYYNIESNCIGKILMSHRKGRKENVVYASPEVLSDIKREPSMGNQPFECREAKEPWSLTLTIPASSFFKHDLKSFNGVKANCNIYKCGDNLPMPHFISWNHIDTPNPDFHRPEFFGELEFEDKTEN